MHSPQSHQARLEEGERRFQYHCAPCHGARADGRGPVAAHLRIPPPDLTRIARRRAGRFDVDEITAFVDGRNRVSAHGSSDMPIWGPVFEAGFAGGDNPIPLIVEYLESIQLAEEPSGERP